MADVNSSGSKPLRKICDPVDIQFSNISYCGTRRDFFHFWMLEKKHILKGINGTFFGGKMCAVIGPSGCGKSSLLDIISGFRNTGISGTVSVNEKITKVPCSYIMQDDLLQPFITVREALNFVADMKLPTCVPKVNKNEIIDMLLNEIGLTMQEDTLTKDLSRGQRKKLAIATELVSDPPVIILDEPTSGLDSKSAKQCIEILRKLALEGRTVICSIHQPSMTLLEMFDNMYMLADGECIYQGSVDQLVPYLRFNNLECPLMHNPVEFVMELCVPIYELNSCDINSEEDKEEILATNTSSSLAVNLCLDTRDKANVKNSVKQSSTTISDLVKSIQNGMLYEWFNKPFCSNEKPLNGETNPNDFKDMNDQKTKSKLDTHAVHDNSLDATNRSDVNKNNYRLENFEPRLHCDKFATSFFHQFRHLLVLKVLIETRDPLLMRLRIVTHIIVGFVLGMVFYDVGDDGWKIMVNMNLIFLMGMFPMYNALTSRIITYPQSLPIVIREYFNKWYSVKAFYLSSLVADMPIQIFSVALFIVPIYVLTGQPPEAERFWRVFAVSNLLPLVFQDYGILVGTLLDVQAGFIIGMFTTAPYIMFSGFFLYYRDTPSIFHPMYEISVLRHAVEGLVVSIFGYGRKDLGCDYDLHVICPFRDPKEFRKIVDISNDRFFTNISFIFFFGVLVKVLCYIALKFRLSRGRWPLCLLVNRPSQAVPEKHGIHLQMMGRNRQSQNIDLSNGCRMEMKIECSSN